MSRSWREEPSTPKTKAQKKPRPRVSEFARDHYQGKGYAVEYCDAPQTLRNNGQFDEIDFLEARGYAEADD